MIRHRFLIATMACAAISALSGHAAAMTLFSDGLDSGAGWGVNASADTAATFGYDYSADAIPEAPNSVGGAATTGLKAEANLSSGTLSVLTAYPTGQNFTGNYQLRFDAWMNIESGAGTTTEFMGGGIGYDGVTADVASGAQAIATGDGGSANDWRAFKSPPQFFLSAAAMTGGTRNGSDAYYADFLPAVPAAQGQAGTSIAGSPGFQWITWEFNVVGNDVSIFIEKPSGDRLEIASYDKTDTSDGSAGVVTDGNISLFYADFFTSVSAAPALQFGLFDNVVVTAIPEPASLGLVLVASCGLLGRQRRR